MRGKKRIPPIPLEEGEAEHLGDGIFLVRQTDDDGLLQIVSLTEQDMRRMLATIGAAW